MGSLSSYPVGSMEKNDLLVLLNKNPAEQDCLVLAPGQRKKGGFFFPSEKRESIV